jgi:hypothetical protein
MKKYKYAKDSSFVGITIIEIDTTICARCGEDVIQQERKAIMAAYGISDQPPQPTSLTLTDLQNIVRRFSNGR